MWFVEGVSDGHVAVIVRLHHSAIDGMGFVEMIMQIFSETADAPPLEISEDTWQGEAIPSPPEALLRALPCIDISPLTSARAIGGVVTGVAKGRAAKQNASPQVETAQLFSATRLPFNEVLDGVPGQVNGIRQRAMSDVKKVRSSFQCTVNDVAVALVAGSLRRCRTYPSSSATRSTFDRSS